MNSKKSIAKWNKRRAQQRQKYHAELSKRLKSLDEDWTNYIAELADRHDIENRETLRSAIFKAQYNYAFESKIIARQRDRDLLDVLADKLREVLWLIEDDINFIALIHSINSDINNLEASIDRLESIMDEVSELYRLAEKGYARPPRQRPNELGSLSLAIEALADYWINKLGRPFTQLFHKRSNDDEPKPLSKAAIFVVDVMRFLDPSVKSVSIQKVMMTHIGTLRKSQE